MLSSHTDNGVCIASSRNADAASRPYIGNVYRPETQTDERFHQLWNQVTPENAAKWNSIESVRDQMSWSLLDDATLFADNFGYPFKFHTLIAGENEPEWMAGLSQEQQLTEVTQWFDAVAARYPEPDQIDVVSEPLAPPSYIDALGGSGVTGWDWIITAFEMARTRFPNSELLLNDFKVAQANQSGANYLTIVGLLKERGLIDGIGIEGHFLEQTNSDSIAIQLESLASFGLPLYLSDLDIDVADDELQLTKMKALIPVFYEQPLVRGITFWGYPALEWLECFAGLDSAQL